MPARFTWVLLTWLCGCSTTATISLTSGERVEAKILGNARDELIVATETGAEVPLARSEISDIDHPGNVAAVAGGLVTAYGSVGILRKGRTCADVEKAPEVNCIAVFSPTAVGVSMLIWGLVTWWNSSHAAAESSRYRSFDEPAPFPSSAFDFSRATAPRAGGAPPRYGRDRRASPSWGWAPGR